MVSGVILASGFSKRMGKDKLLLKLGHITIIEKVIRAAVESLLNEVILVYRRETIKTIADAYHIKTVKNEEADKGQSASVIKGANAADPGSDALIFMVGDQPFLNSNTINHLIHWHFKTPGHIIVPTYDGHRGNPVLFPSSFIGELLKIQGDKGGRTIIDTAGDHVTEVKIEQPEIGYDIDTPADFEKIR